MDKLLNNIKFEKKYVLFSLIIVILGIITGSLFITILDSSDKNLVIEYVSSFIENLDNNILLNTLICNVLTISIIIIIGFTFFLFPINIIILFYKAFIIGFTLSSFILIYRLKGILISIIYIFPHMIINILVFSLLTAFTTKISLIVIKYIIKRKELNMRVYFNKYISIVFFSVLIIILTSLYESYVMIYLLKFVRCIL